MSCKKSDTNALTERILHKFSASEDQFAVICAFAASFCRNLCRSRHGERAAGKPVRLPPRPSPRQDFPKWAFCHSLFLFLTWLITFCILEVESA